MTKADIVNEIAKGRECLSTWLRQFYCEEKSTENRTQHFKEHHYHHPRAQHSCF